MKESNKTKVTLKTEPKLKVNLNDEQKEFVKQFYEFDVCFLHGDFGSGKSLAAVHTALTAFRKKQYSNIWITRPMLKNSLAALPGTLEEKMAPYTFPIIQNMEVCQGKEITDKMLKEGEVKIMPIEVAKGCSFIDSVVIVDEYQDMNYQDFRTILTRLSKGSKMIFCGSIEQIDKQIGKNSCIYDTIRLEKSGLVGYRTLKSNHRNETLTAIIEYLENA
jgi:phosphate starvation-inducible PhoH-like protein